MREQILRDENLINFCLYCKNELNGEWNSFFCGDEHYKDTNCECGKNISIRVTIDSDLEKKLN